LARIHYRKFATGGYTASPPNTVCVTTLPCEILITTLRMFVHVCYHKYAGNKKTYSKYLLWITLMLVSDITQITAHYCNVVHGHYSKGFAAA